ncbi:beta/gamma crystallin domain-containing protein [Streptomyces sp. CB01580]|uniref:beta/gamma crystallin domain-containing protein n=1 Tax=Streptomyces sp. CB01580 TaxID=1703933 RepID=UPI000939A264|nr:beta/gamma crystallin domain-containing protein [Streptomyces sp. CB01580]
MKRSLSRLAVTVVAAGALTGLLPASTAAAINQTDCGDRTDFVKVTYNGGEGTVCYANKGVVTPNLPNVKRVSSGNNNIEMWLGNEAISMNKWSTIVDIEDLNQTLYALQIR